MNDPGTSDLGRSREEGGTLLLTGESEKDREKKRGAARSLSGAV